MPEFLQLNCFLLRPEASRNNKEPKQVGWSFKEHYVILPMSDTSTRFHHHSLLSTLPWAPLSLSPTTSSSPSLLWASSYYGGFNAGLCHGMFVFLWMTWYKGLFGKATELNFFKFIFLLNWCLGKHLLFLTQFKFFQPNFKISLLKIKKKLIKIKIYI